MRKDKEWLPISNRLKTIFEELQNAGYTKKQLCQILGERPQNINLYLDGFSNPSKFANEIEKLGYSKEWFLYGIGNPKQTNKKIITFTEREKEIITLVNDFYVKFKKIMENK